MDLNYMHEYDPARHGGCKTIVSGRICGQLENYQPHIRFQARKEDALFQSFEVRESKCFDAFHVNFCGVRATEEMRQFVEDAIREKLERL